MVIFEIVRRVFNSGSLSETSRQIARRCYASLHQVVEHRAMSMTRAEARGYIAAKARPIVRQEVESVIRTVHGIGAWARPVLVLQASEQLVHAVSSELVRERARKVRPRRAA